ncbi:MAG: MerR family transcriptional regulator [Deltaproteobacteria bacterium]|nr:MerR family transcriptional regulator [Deltaproteobacteria bacterium]
MAQGERGDGGRQTGKSGRARRRGAEKIYYRIGEVSRITDVKPYVLRYWESEFRWMAPAKSRSKQRLYRKRDIEVIQLIKRLLYEERFTIAGARKKLRELGVGRALDAPQLEMALEEDPRAQLRRIRNELQEIRGLL